MAKAFVVCEIDYTYKTEATVLESFHGDKLVSSMEVPGQTYEYKAGKTYQFSTKKGANDFIKFHSAKGGKFRIA